MQPKEDGVHHIPFRGLCNSGTAVAGASRITGIMVEVMTSSCSISVVGNVVRLPEGRESAVIWEGTELFGIMRAMHGIASGNVFLGKTDLVFGHARIMWLITPWLLTIVGFPM